MYKTSRVVRKKSIFFWEFRGECCDWRFCSNNKEQALTVSTSNLQFSVHKCKCASFWCQSWWRYRRENWVRSVTGFLMKNWVCLILLRSALYRGPKTANETSQNRHRKSIAVDESKWTHQANNTVKRFAHSHKVVPESYYFFRCSLEPVCWSSGEGHVYLCAHTENYWNDLIDCVATSPTGYIEPEEIAFWAIDTKGVPFKSTELSTSQPKRYRPRGPQVLVSKAPNARAH